MTPVLLVAWFVTFVLSIVSCVISVRVEKGTLTYGELLSIIFLSMIPILNLVLIIETVRPIIAEFDFLSKTALDFRNKKENEK